MNFSKPWLPSDKSVVGNSFVPRKVPSGAETSALSSELKANMTSKVTEQKDLVHFDSAGFSKFFSRSEVPAKLEDDLQSRPAKETPEEVSRVMEALKLEESEINQEGEKKQEKLFDSPDFVDDFDKLSRIFSNEKLEKPKVIPFLPNSSQTLVPCLSERTAIRKPSNFYDNQAQVNRFYGSYNAPFYGSPQVPSFVPRTAGRSDQPESNRSWNTAENHNTSMTTAASHGHLEKVDFMHHRTDSADNNSFGSPFFPAAEQQYHHPQFQSTMMYGFVPLQKNATSRNSNFPMMQLPITEEDAYEGMSTGTSYYSGENPAMQMTSAKHGQMTSFFDSRPPQGHFDYHMQQQQQQQQGGQQGGKFLPIGGGKKGDGKGNIYGKALAQRMKAKYGAGGGNYEDCANIFDVDVKRIETCRKTTLMIRNIPNKYNLPLILEAIDKNHKGKYDFFYLPIDFRNNCNVGYAFINFSDTRFIKDFYEEFNGKKWDKFNSEKICDIKYARIQGRDALIQHFEYSSVMNQADKKLKPVILPKNDLSSIESLVQVQKAALDENKAALC